MAVLQPEPRTLFRNAQWERSRWGQGRSRRSQPIVRVPDSTQRGDCVEVSEDGRTRLGRLAADPDGGVAEFRMLELSVEQPNTYSEIGKRITVYEVPREQKPNESTTKPDYSFGEWGVGELAALGIEIQNDALDAGDKKSERDPGKARQLRDTLTANGGDHHHISMALTSKNTPNPPAAHAMVHRNSSARFSTRMASLNESLNFLPSLVQPFFWDAMFAALVATAAVSGNAIIPKMGAAPSFSSATPNNTAAIATAPITINAMTIVATNLRPVTTK